VRDTDREAALDDLDRAEREAVAQRRAGARITRGHLVEQLQLRARADAIPGAEVDVDVAPVDGEDDGLGAGELRERTERDEYTDECEALHLELHRRAGPAGEAGDRLVSCRIADAQPDAQARSDLACDVVVEAHAGIAVARGKVRDLDRR